MKRIIIIGLILIGLCSCRKDKELLDEIYNDPGYAIGKITSSSTVVMVLTYHYDYQAGNTTHKGKKEGGITNSPDSRMIGRRFLVVYKQSDPKQSDLNFRYPINTDQDFLDLLEQFKSSPPKR